MRVCIIVEGCYPYVVGGVSSWVHSLIKQFPHIEFVIQTIAADRSIRGKYVYELPTNVIEVRETYVQDDDWVTSKRTHKLHLNQKEFQAFQSMLLNKDIDWDTIFHFFANKKFSVNMKISLFLTSCGHCVRCICLCFSVCGHQCQRQTCIIV